MKENNNDRNNFGNLSMEYRAARKGYPDELFIYLKSLVEKEKPVVLDLGCGTGIATGQLSEHSFAVTGADKDLAMMKGNMQETPNIPYVAATVDHIPFPPNRFDMVTAFNSFHWFNNEKSLTEIKRVLTTGGVFFAGVKINRIDHKNEDFIKGYQALLRKYVGEKFNSVGDHFKKEPLVNVGFSDITEKSFQINEKYTIEEALTLMRSMSLWNLVPEDKKEEMLKEAREFFQAHSTDGFVVMYSEISTVTAFKK